MIVCRKQVDDAVVRDIWFRYLYKKYWHVPIKSTGAKLSRYDNAQLWVKGGYSYSAPFSLHSDDSLTWHCTHVSGCSNLLPKICSTIQRGSYLGIAHSVRFIL